MPLVDRVADRLADQVVRDRVALQLVRVQKVVRPLAVVLVGFLDLEVVAPAGQLDAVVTPLLALLADLLERQVGPLAGEKRHGT